MTCPADAIPDFFEFNLEGLEIGRSVHISAIKLPEGVKPTIINRDFTVATIAGHKIEEEPTAGAEVAVEGAVPAEGEEARSCGRGCRRRQGCLPARKPRPLQGSRRQGAAAQAGSGQACRRQGQEIGAAPAPGPLRT